MAVLTTMLDSVVAECLCTAAIDRPPVDVFALARRRGIDVILDSSQASRGRHARVAGRSAIFIRPDDRAERQQWAVAHELGETLACELPGDALGREFPSSDREQVANLLASRILLPGDWFFADAARLGHDLYRLKERYTTASHELIAFRLLDLAEPACITVFDQGRPTRRRCNRAERAPPLDQAELGCWQEAHRFCRAVDREASGRRVQVWPIHEAEWRREILRTTWPAEAVADEWL